MYRGELWSETEVQLLIQLLSCLIANKHVLVCMNESINQSINQSMIILINENKHSYCHVLQDMQGHIPLISKSAAILIDHPTFSGIKSITEFYSKTCPCNSESFGRFPVVDSSKTRICAAEMAVRYAALSACRKVHVCHCNSLGGAT